MNFENAQTFHFTQTGNWTETISFTFLASNRMTFYVGCMHNKTEMYWQFVHSKKFGVKSEVEKYELWIWSGIKCLEKEYEERKVHRNAMRFNTKISHEFEMIGFSCYLKQSNIKSLT